MPVAVPVDVRERPTGCPVGVRVFATASHPSDERPDSAVFCAPLAEAVVMRNPSLFEASVKNLARAVHSRSRGAPGARAEKDLPPPTRMALEEKSAWQALTRAAVLSVEPADILVVLEGLLLLLRHARDSATGASLRARLQALRAAFRFVACLPVNRDVPDALLTAMTRGTGYFEAFQKATGAPFHHGEARFALHQSVGEEGLNNVRGDVRELMQSMLLRISGNRAVRAAGSAVTYDSVKELVRREKKQEERYREGERRRQNAMQNVFACEPSEKARAAVEDELRRATQTSRRQAKALADMARDADHMSTKLPLNGTLKGPLDRDKGLKSLPDGKGGQRQEAQLSMDTPGHMLGALRPFPPPPAPSSEADDRFGVMGTGIYNRPAPDDVNQQREEFERVAQDLLACVQVLARVNAARHGEGSGGGAGGAGGPGIGVERVAEAAQSLMPIACLTVCDELLFSRLHGNASWQGVYQFADYMCGAAFALPLQTEALPSRQSLAVLMAERLMAANPVLDPEHAGTSALRSKLVIGECLDRGLLHRDDAVLATLSMAVGCSATPLRMAFAARYAGAAADWGNEGVRAWVSQFYGAIHEDVLACIAPDEATGCVALASLVMADAKDPRRAACRAATDAYVRDAGTCAREPAVMRPVWDGANLANHWLGSDSRGWSDLRHCPVFAAVWKAFYPALTLMAFDAAAVGVSPAWKTVADANSTRTLVRMVQETCAFSTWRTAHHVVPPEPHDVLRARALCQVLQKARPEEPAQTADRKGASASPWRRYTQKYPPPYAREVLASTLTQSFSEDSPLITVASHRGRRRRRAANSRRSGPAAPRPSAARRRGRPMNSPREAAPSVKRSIRSKTTGAGRSRGDPIATSNKSDASESSAFGASESSASSGSGSDSVSGSGSDSGSSAYSDSEGSAYTPSGGGAAVTTREPLRRSIRLTSLRSAGI